MPCRRLGATGLPVSVLSLGAADVFGDRVSRGTARNLVAMAWDAGVNLFDSLAADAGVRAQAMLGDVIADLRLPRDGLALSAGVGVGDGTAQACLPMQRGMTRKHLRDACEAALRRLHTDYLDLFLCERPDPQVPLLETVTAMDLLVRQGKVLYWGTCEWPTDMIAQARAIAADHALQGPMVVKTARDLLTRDSHQHPLAALAGEGKIGWLAPSSLAGARRTADDQGDGPHAATAGDGMAGCSDRFLGVADTMGVGPEALAAAWILRDPAVASVLVEVLSAQQLQGNLDALALLAEISDEQWHAVDAASATG